MREPRRAETLFSPAGSGRSERSRTTHSFVLLLAALPTVVALVLWAMSDVEWFVLIAVLVAAVFPATLLKPFGTNIAAVDLLLVVAVVVWIVRNALRRAPDPWIRRNPLLPAAALFVTVNGLSMIWSIHPRSTLIFTVQLVELVVVFPIVFASLPTSIKHITRGLDVLIGVTTVLAVATLIAHVSKPPRGVDYGTGLPGLQKNALGAFLAAGLVLAFARSMRSGTSRRRVLLLCACAIEIAGVIATESRGAVIGGGIAILVLALLLGQRRTFAVVVVTALAVLYAAVIVPEERAKARVSGGYDSSVVRSYSWKDGLRRIERYPWLGTGGATYRDRLWQLRGFIVDDPDNLILLTWGELGIPGLLALSFLLGRFGQLLVRCRRLPDDAAGVAAAAGCVSLAGLLHFMVDVSWSRGETTLVFAMMGLMLATTRLAEPPAAAGGTPEESGAAVSPPPPPAPALERPVLV